MRPIGKGESGPAVEDIQQRLAILGFDLGQESIDGQFGDTTAQAVCEFRKSMGLDECAVVDEACWHALVDESFVMGDRSLYLRYPNFHGRDVSTLQSALNTLGFACGKADGIYGVFTERAVKEFQANMGLFPDGIAFTDTFNALERLHHSWANKNQSAHSCAQTGLSRAVQVIEGLKLCISGADPISRNVAGRLWNVAAATSEHSQFQLVTRLDEDEKKNFDVIIEISSVPADQQRDLRATVVLRDKASLSSRIKAAYEAAIRKGLNPPEIRLELEQRDYYDGSFTGRVSQHIAIEILDALCTVFEDLVEKEPVSPLD